MGKMWLHWHGLQVVQLGRGRVAVTTVMMVVLRAERVLALAVVHRANMAIIRSARTEANAR